MPTRAEILQRALLAPNDPELIASHEAGHVLMAHVVSVPIRYVTIEPRGAMLGCMHSVPLPQAWQTAAGPVSPEEKQARTRRALVDLGGMSVERMLYGKCYRDSVRPDINAASVHARRLAGAGEPGANQLMGWFRTTCTVLCRPVVWQALEAFVPILQKERTMTADQICAFLTDCGLRYRPPAWHD
jgi:hypothetical protein